MTPERVEVNDLGSEHPVSFGYYGGPADGRMSRMKDMNEDELLVICEGALPHGYTVTRYGVHADTTLCWVLLMYSPIAERGKL